MASLPGVDRTLPKLTREELRALEDEPVVTLVEEDAWWTSLAEDERERVRSAATRSLMARDLIWPTGKGEAEAEMHPDLALLLNVRYAPTWVLALGERQLSGDGSAVHDQPQGGVLVCGAAEGNADNAVICAPVGGLYLNRLTTRELAIGAATDYLLRAPTDSAAVTQRSVDVVVPERPHRHGVVTGSGDTWMFSEQRAEEREPRRPAPADAEAVQEWIRWALHSEGEKR